ncbi:MAG: hypothetical protein HYZ38_26365 [Mycobacterium sp.]|nr:hypothetical protein [Mycobacterium sp.]
MHGPFIGAEALAAGAVTPYELRRYCRRLLPGVYVPARTSPGLAERAEAAWLWSRREGVVSGLAASALHGAKWVGDDTAVELIWPNHRAPHGVITRNDTVLDDEIQSVRGLMVTTPERTAFDLARRGPVRDAVARLDALSRVTGLKTADILALAERHWHVRGLRRLPDVLELVDTGAQSPKETWLRLLLIDAGFPRPQTQIPVPGPDGYPRYYLDMGWQEVMLAVEYDGEQHRSDRRQYVTDIRRLDEIAERGWRLLRVVAGDREPDIIRRVKRAWPR